MGIEGNIRVGVIGLGYVGLPLAVEFGKYFNTTGFDVSEVRIDELKQGKDRTREVCSNAIDASRNLVFTSYPADISNQDFYIVTVPTPVDEANNPDLVPLQTVCEMLGALISRGAVIVFESTVFPGCTRDFCVPLLEQVSGLSHNRDFYTGYSPERINPGDKQHRLTDILKVTSGSTPEVADRIDDLYATIIKAGTFKAASIEVAEAAKVIENTQRDLNIALMNELAIIFHKLDLDTNDVLEAAGTKWNFLPFQPGLVGGHCIGVDPYYLTHRAQQVGYHPEIILAGRRINDSMASYVADRVLQAMIAKEIVLVGARVLVCGLTFKEDCPDLRNSKVFDLIDRLTDFHLRIDVWDPSVDDNDRRHLNKIRLLETKPQQADYDAIVLAVPHSTFRSCEAKELKSFGKPNSAFFDVKGIFHHTESDGRL